MCYEGRIKLISHLEGIFHDHVVNNGNPIRYPITFSGEKELRGRYILRVTEENVDIFYSGRYRFGANSFYVYKAIDSLLFELSRMNLIDEWALQDLLEEYQQEYDEEVGQ